MLSDVVRLVRKFHNSTQSELASKLGISKSFLSEIESGKKSISIDLLQRYSEIYSIPMSHFFLFDEKLNDGSSRQKIKTMAATKFIAILNWIDAIADKHNDDEHTPNRSITTI